MILNASLETDLDLKNFDINKIVERELESVASDIEKTAKKNAPVDTGKLRNSIESEAKGLEANIGTDCEYAGYVHDGTYKMAARPFLDMAAEKELQDIEDEIADEIARLL